jgi:thiamine kinase-like enzyme
MIQKKSKKTRVRESEEKIAYYLKHLSPNAIGLDSIDYVKILSMTPGAYNLNYHVEVNHRKFIFRINIEAQSGLANQIKYEYQVLKFLESHHIAPKVYHLDDTCEVFDFGILIQEYLNGPHLIYKTNQILEVAHLLVRLHSLPFGDMDLITWQNPLLETFNLARTDLRDYKKRKNSDRTIIHLATQLLENSKPLLEAKRNFFKVDSVNHTDVVCDNFIRTADGLRMIDWEKPRADDCSYDIGCFLSEPAQLWCTEDIVTPKDRDRFVHAYAQQRGKDVGLLFEKVDIREPLISLHWILWGAIKLCDLEDRRTLPELFRAHEEKISRYRRLARSENIEKLLDTKHR